MSLQNLVTTTFKAETAGYVAAVKHMRGVERDEAKKTLATLEQQNAKLTDQLAVLGKATAAIGAVTLAWKAAQAAANAHLEDLRLESAAAGANVDRLRDATRGLVETDNLLSFAGRAMHGVWKLNQQEMETVAKGTDVLAKRLGVDLQTAMEGVTEAVTKGTTKSLKELGIEAKDKESALRAFAEAARDAGAGGDTAGEKWQQASVKMKDAWDDLQGAMGELVVSLAPLVAAVAELVSHIQKLANLIPQLPGAEGGEGFLSSSWKNIVTMGGYSSAQGIGWLFGGEDEATVSGGSWDKALARQQAKGHTVADLIAAGLDAGARNNSFANPNYKDSSTVGGLSRAYSQIYGAASELGARALAETAEEIKKLQGRKPGKPLVLPYNPGDPVQAFGDAAGGAQGLFGAFGAVGQGMAADYAAAANAPAMKFGLGGPEADAAATKRFREEMAGIAQELAELDRQLAGPTILERIFGKPDEIDAMVVGIDLARDAVETFGKAGAAAMGAWITGEQSMADAIKGVLAQSLMALAMESTVKALFHLAAAAGNAAFGNFASAGMHIKAAGMYGAVAVAAGVGAKAAHSAGWAGGGNSPSAVGAGGNLGGRGSGRYGEGDGGGERTVVVALGRDFNMLTDLEQRQLLNRAIRIGSADNGGTSHVRFR